MVRNVRDDRIAIQFNDKRFIEILKKWKFYCNGYEGGQTARLMVVIEEDLKKIKSEVMKKMDV